MRGTRCEECGLRGLVRIIRRINLEGKPWLCNACFEKRLYEEQTVRERARARKE